MSDWWTTTPVQSTEDTVPTPPTTEDTTARHRAMVEEIQRLMEPITIDPVPPRCTCRYCLGSSPPYTCAGRCSDCGDSTCAQCRRNYPHSDDDDTCGECEGSGCSECCDHDVEGCCGWCDACETHPEDSGLRESEKHGKCNRGHCHDCEHDCSSDS